MLIKPKMTNWSFYPKNKKIPEHLENVIEAFNKAQMNISSDLHSLPSNEVLKNLSSGLEGLGYIVEQGKTKEKLIKVPVLFGVNGEIEKGFDADAVNTNLKTVVEIEAGRAVTNYQFLKDLFQSFVMIDIEYAVIAVRNNYKRNKDFLTVCKFIDAIYLSDRFTIPLKGILILGY